MGRTHGKDTTFARAADNMGFVPKEDILELCKVKNNIAHKLQEGGMSRECP